MKVIDSDNYMASGIETLFFPGGEPHARIPANFGPALLYLKARTWNDVGLALCVLDALFQQQKGQQFHRIWMFCPYFPGARQDRTDLQTPITAQMMLKMFMTSPVDRIFTFDAHSGVVGNTVYHNFMPSDLPINKLYSHAPYIIIPDAGAKKRCEDFDSMFHSSYDLIQCEKHRDFATGKFTGFKMPKLPGPATYLIVDDICDGGGTFNLLADEFKKDSVSGFSRLHLWVSHGIFSRGEVNISPVIEKIYTTDSFYKEMVAHEVLSPRTEVISLQPIIDEILESARAIEEIENV